MAFTIRKRESYRWPVEHTIEVRDGKPEVMSFDAEFRACKQAQVKDLMDRARASSITDAEFLDAILVEIHGLQDEAGKVYRRADLDELLELFPGLIASLSRAWTESVVGAARKNS